MRKIYGMAGALVVLALAAGILCAAAPGPNPVTGNKTVDSAYARLKIEEPPQRQNTQPLVLAHYMPWFQKFGYHWSEGSSKFDPGTILPDGRANIASHYYPLTGNYDSADTALIEYQLSLMKMAGIDGVIVDWYGITEGLDYTPIHKATQALFEVIKKRGLKFVICYEDQSIKHLANSAVIDKNAMNATAKETFDWMAKNWFSSDVYVKVDGRPLVLCFGPQQFYQQSEWEGFWADINPKPFFVDLDARTKWADAAQNWSPMHLSRNGKLGLADLVAYLNKFYQGQKLKPFVVGTVVPAFHDIYAEAGKKSYGFLDFFGGETLKLTWAAAERARANVIQIQTWNDYGEGTVVEPTIERGYTSLEFIQDKRAEWVEDHPFTYADLRIPIELYKIAVDEKATAAQKTQIAAIYNAIFAGDANAARRGMRTAEIIYDFAVSPLLQNPADKPPPAAAFSADGRMNLAYGKKATESSHVHDWWASKATDGVIQESYWEGAARVWPGILSVDLGKVEKIATVVIKLDPRRLWQARVQTFEIKVSNDGQTWTTAVPSADYSFDPVGNANTVAVELTAEARHVQLVFTRNTQATNGQVAELEVYGE